MAPTPGTRVTSTSDAGNFALSFAAAGISPVSSRVDDLLLERLADARELGGPAGPGKLLDRDGALADRLRGFAVGEDAVPDGPVELVEGGELVSASAISAFLMLQTYWRPGRRSRALNSIGGWRRTLAVWLVIPTYNESANLETIVEAAREVLPPSRRILIVDDYSPDGTGAIADRLADAHEDVGGAAPARQGGPGAGVRGGLPRRRWRVARS